MVDAGLKVYGLGECASSFSSAVIIFGCGHCWVVGLVVGGVRPLELEMWLFAPAPARVVSGVWSLESGVLVLLLSPE